MIKREEERDIKIYRDKKIDEEKRLKRSRDPFRGKGENIQRYNHGVVNIETDTHKR